jgi:fructoselysine-6-P-deglycase FrlB-like protein
MGKPYDKDLSILSNTIDWSINSDSSPNTENFINTCLETPLLTVGSGGSYSTAFFVAQLHEQYTGQIAKALTPLMFLTSQISPVNQSVILFSAGGGNKDIYNAIESALKREFKNTIVVCANEKNKILGLKKKYPQLNLYSFNNPAGKDGFLAINSLISTCILILKTYNFIKPLFDLSDLSSLKKISFPKS